MCKVGRGRSPYISLEMWLVRQLVSLCPQCGAALGRGKRGAVRNLSSSLTFSPPKRVVLVRKTTRLEYERMKNKLTDETLRNRLSLFGSDYDILLQRHSQHNQSLDIITDFLETQGVTLRIRDRESYSNADVEWAESVFSAGGDGNFLYAASKVLTPDKLVVGFNTDPNSSEGYLCIDSSHYGSLLGALQAIYLGKVQTYHRARIRVEVGGALLPVRSLNEVFVGEKNPSHASYYELSTAGPAGSEKQKSSGLLIYTGTGSTSWAYNANKLTSEQVNRILTLLAPNMDGGVQAPERLLSKVVEEYNSANIFDGSKMELAYVVREPIVRGIFAAQNTHGKASSLSVRSLSWNTQLVIDGCFHYNLKRGGVARCWLHPQDMLTTIQ